MGGSVSFTICWWALLALTACGPSQHSEREPIRVQAEVRSEAAELPENRGWVSDLADLLTPDEDREAGGRQRPADRRGPG